MRERKYFCRNKNICAPAAGAVAAALLAASGVARADMTLFTTQDDFAGWTSNAQMNQGPSATDLDGSSSNGLISATPGSPGTPGSLGVSWVSGTYNFFAGPGEQNNPAFLNAMGTSGTLAFDYTTPPAGTGNYFQIGLLLNYTSNFGQFFGSSVNNGNGTSTANIQYTINTMPTYSYFQLGLIYNSNFNTNTVFNIDNIRVLTAPPPLDQASGSWKTNGSGNWVDANNWDTGTPGQIPGAPGSEVTFDTHGGSITTTNQIVVTLNQPASVINMNFNKGGGGYRIAGTSQVNLTANANVTSGSHVISVLLNASSGAAFNIAAGSTLQVDQLTGGSFGQFVKTGDGALITDKVQNVNVDIQGGSWTLKPGNAQANGFVYGLTLQNGATFNMNGAQLQTNAIYTGAAPGTIDLGTGGVLTTGQYLDASPESPNPGFVYGGGITGAGSVIIRGGNDVDHPTESPHTIEFVGLNSYSGTTTVRNLDTLAVSNSNNFGNGSATNYLILDNGRLLANGDFTTSRKVSLTALGGTIDTNSHDVGFGVIDPGPFTKAGAGALTVTRLDNLTTVTVNGGLLKIAPNGTSTGVSKIGNLTLSGGTSLDLTNNSLITTGTGLPTVQSLVSASYAGGAWTGAGITSSAAAAVAADGSNVHKTALGYATAAAIGVSSFGGQSVNPTDVLVRYTLSGDANLDALVNGLDFNALASHFGAAGAVWSSGDFNFDGMVNSADFGMIAVNFNAAPAAPGAFAALSALVPEPASLTGLAGGALLLGRRRREFA